MISQRIILFCCFAAVPLLTQADAVDQLKSDYLASGAHAFSAEAGEKVWSLEVVDSASGEKRSCSVCHTQDLQGVGKHKTTGKPIQPMAPSVNPERYTDAAKIEKWFKRNCKWTLGRECSPQEKGDMLTYLQGL